MIQAETDLQRIPVLSVEYPAMDVNTAYGIQKAFIEKKSSREKLAGFKAGLTSEKGQKRFGLTAPVAGALFESGRLTGESIVESKAFHRLMIETEIGFVIGENLSQPLHDVTALRKSIRAVMPVVELQDS